MNHRTNTDRPSFALLGGQRITGLHIARMFRALTGRVPTADQVMASQQALDARYAELEAEMAKPKDEKKKGSGVDYGQLTADALNGRLPPLPKEQPKKPAEKEPESKGN
jgi:hypothetical protein